MVSAANYGNAVNRPTPFIGIIVNNAANVHFSAVQPVDIPQDGQTGITGANEHNALDLTINCGRIPLPHQQNKPVREPNSQGHQKMHTAAQNIVGYGHSSKNQRDQNAMQQSIDRNGKDRAHQLCDAGKPPNAVVKLQTQKYHYANDCADRCKTQRRF